MNEKIKDFEYRILCSLRRIIRSVDIYSNKLKSKYGLTTPQLLCLQCVVENDGSTLSQLTANVNLSGSTITGIVDRLESKGLLKRERSLVDRRKIFLHSTDTGKEVVAAAPSLLQDRLSEALSELAENEQDIIAESLERVVKMMEAENVNASPNLISGIQ
ncbi:MAG: MarR family transcriptional regulator [Lentisphaerae bacterium]|nr:MarR family transcriptional regulator [Lentisphaerota bacterium]MCP4102980.1 MarR family transcriptional regulator [Lentisphaerota bacterium]